MLFDEIREPDPSWVPKGVKGYAGGCSGTADMRTLG